MSEHNNLFNTLHMVFLYVIYMCSIKYIKNTVILREFLLINKYPVHRMMPEKQSTTLATGRVAA